MFESFIHFASQRFRMKIATRENRLDSFAEFGGRLVRRTLDVVAREAPQERFGLCGSQAKRRVFHHPARRLTAPTPNSEAVIQADTAFGQAEKQDAAATDPRRPG
jgi:hypothetical protein